MDNLAAIVPGPRAPLEVCHVETYNPGPAELLIRNERIAFNQIEAKIAKLAAVPIAYPAILGSTFSGTIESVGEHVTGFQVGERVVVTKRFGTVGNQYGAYQRYVVVKDIMVSKVPTGADVGALASVMMNTTCVVGLFSGRVGLDRPGHGNASEKNGDTRILVYGGSSSFGSLSVRYLSQAGYQVVTTSSPAKAGCAKKMGAAAVIDHIQGADDLEKALFSHGPYDVVADMISAPMTIKIIASVVAAQGGGKLYATQPVSAELVPEGVQCVFEPWSDSLYEENNKDLQRWTVQECIPSVTTPEGIELIDGGLHGIDEALGRLHRSGGGVRLLADPWA